MFPFARHFTNYQDDQFARAVCGARHIENTAPLPLSVGPVPVTHTRLYNTHTQDTNTVVCGEEGELEIRTNTFTLLYVTGAAAGCDNLTDTPS